MRRLSNKSARIRTSFSGAILRLSSKTQGIGTSFIYMSIYTQYIYICIYLHVHTHVRTYIYIFKSCYFHIHICEDTYVSSCTHTYICQYRCLCFCFGCDVWESRWLICTPSGAWHARRCKCIDSAGSFGDDVIVGDARMYIMRGDILHAR